MYYETYSAGMLLSELEEAGIVEVYEANKENMGNRHTDSIGEYKGDALEIIPVGARIEYSVLDAEENEFNTLEDAQEFYYGEEIPAQLREMLIAGRKVIGVSREGDEREFYFSDEFDKEEYARQYYASDLSGMIILDSFEDAYWELQHRSGHQAAGIKSACEEIIEHNA